MNQVNLGLGVRLRLAQTHDFIASLELPTLLQQLNALEPFQDIPLRGDGALTFETAVLRHKNVGLKRAGTLAAQLAMATPFSSAP